VIQRLAEKFNPKILAVILDPEEAALHRRAINATTRVLTSQEEQVSSSIPWWFNSNDPRMKKNRDNFTQGKEVAENRQSGEDFANNGSSPQSDDESLFQSFGYTNQNQKGNQQMIKLQRSNAPEGQSTPKGIQFLSPKHVQTPEGFTAEVSKVKTPENGVNLVDNYRNPYVVLFVSGSGEKYQKGFKPTSDLLAELVGILGDDESKWIGKRIIINKKVDDDFGERLTFSPTISPVAPPKGKR